MPLKTPTKGKFTDSPKKHFLKKIPEKKKKRKNLTKQNKTKTKNKKKNKKQKKTKKQNKTKKTQQQLAFYSWYHCLVSSAWQGNDIKNKMLGVVLELPTDVETI